MSVLIGTNKVDFEQYEDLVDKAGTKLFSRWLVEHNPTTVDEIELLVVRAVFESMAVIDAVIDDILLYDLENHIKL